MRQGQTLAAGATLGAVGTTGNSTGTHLHLEARLGDAADYSSVTPKGKGRIDPESWAALFGLSLSSGDSVGVASTVYMPIISG